MSKSIKTSFFSVKAFDSYPCELETFAIRGKHANWEDFGTSRDAGTKSDPEDWEPVCACMKFFPSSKPKKGVLEKYNITEAEWREICKALKDVLRVGECSMCL